MRTSGERTEHESAKRKNKEKQKPIEKINLKIKRNKLGILE